MKLRIVIAILLAVALAGVFPLNVLAQESRSKTSFPHQSEFSVVLIGTGSPRPSEERSQASALVHYRSNYFLVDCGDGTRKRLVKGGFNPGSIKNILFTHHHLDHNADYFEVSVNALVRGRTNATIAGPAGTAALHDFFTEFYREDIRYRMRGRADLDAVFATDTVKEIEDKTSFGLDGVTISTAQMTHTLANLAYRFEVNGQSIVISGDTSYDTDLITLAKDADILVMDSGALKPSNRLGSGQSRQGGQQKLSPHPTMEEVAIIAAGANVKKLVLTHFTRKRINTRAITAVLRKHYSGEIIIGEDLMEIVP